MDGRCQLARVGVVGHGVGEDDAVFQVDDARRVPLGQLRVVGDHDDEAVFRDLFQKLHDLNTRLAVQCAGRLVGQQDVRVVDEGARNGDTLHLAAGHLGGVFVQLVAQANLLQCLSSTAFPLRAGDARDRQGQLDVSENGLMGDQIVALEHETDGVVAVGIPVAVGVLFGGDAVDDQVAAVVPVKAADDVQQGGLAGTTGAEDGDKFVVAQVQADLIQCSLDKVAGLVFLVYLF